MPGSRGISSPLSFSFPSSSPAMPPGAKPGQLETRGRADCGPAQGCPARSTGSVGHCGQAAAVLYGPGSGGVQLPELSPPLRGSPGSLPGGRWALTSDWDFGGCENGALLPLGEQSQKAKGNTELVGSARGSDTLEVSRELPGVPCSAPVSLPRSHAVPPASWERAAWSSEEGPLGRDRTHPYRGPPRAQEAQGPGDWRGRDGPGAGEGCELPQPPHPRAGSRADLILGNPTGSCSSSMASPSARWEVLGDCAPWTRLRGSASPDAGCPRSMLASRQHVWASPSGDKNTCLVSFLGTLGRCRAGEH